MVKKVHGRLLTFARCFTTSISTHHEELQYQISSISSAKSSSTGKSPTSTRSGRTKTPQLGLQSKYLAPATVPSFLPVGSSSAMPIHGCPGRPGICGTGPMKRIVPRRSSVAGRRRQRLLRAMPGLLTQSLACNPSGKLVRVTGCSCKVTCSPLSSTSRSSARTFCSSILGALGSNRPSFCAFFQASTLSLRASYSSAGMLYFSTKETSVKSVRAAAGRVSWTWFVAMCQIEIYRGGTRSGRRRGWLHENFGQSGRDWRRELPVRASHGNWNCR